MRSSAPTTLLSVLFLPFLATAANYQVNFLTNGGQSCVSNLCTDVATGTTAVGTFSLTQSQLLLDGIVDISATSNFPNVTGAPPTGTGSAFFAAVVANHAVDDILIGVQWVQYVLDFGTNYVFLAGDGEWGHNTLTTGGPLNIHFYRFGTYKIEALVDPVPEPGTVSLLAGAFALLLRKGRGV